VRTTLPITPLSRTRAPPIKVQRVAARAYRALGAHIIEEVCNGCPTRTGRDARAVDPQELQKSASISVGRSRREWLAVLPYRRWGAE